VTDLSGRDLLSYGRKRYKRANLINNNTTIMNKYEKLVQSMEVLLESFEQIYKEKADSIYLTGEQQEIIGGLMKEYDETLTESTGSAPTFLGLDIKEPDGATIKEMPPNYCIVSRDEGIEAKQEEGAKEQQCLSIDLSPIYPSYEEPKETSISVRDVDGKENIVFIVEDKPVLAISGAGMLYGGKVVEDSGEAYRALMRVLAAIEEAQEVDG